MREKKERKATVTLRNVQGTTSKVEAVDSDMMGAALRPLTDAEKKELNLPLWPGLYPPSAAAR